MPLILVVHVYTLPVADNITRIAKFRENIILAKISEITVTFAISSLPICQARMYGRSEEEILEFGKSRQERLGLGNITKLWKNLLVLDVFTRSGKRLTF